jgi:hypothetical protein
MRHTIWILAGMTMGLLLSAPARAQEASPSASPAPSGTPFKRERT